MAEDVVHDADRRRFEIIVDGVVAGFAEYQLDDAVATFDHTVIGAEFGGRGLATTLVTGAFEQVRAAGQWRIRPECPFVVAFAKKHPEYADLLDY